MSKESSRLISLIVKSDVKCRDYNFDYVNLHRLSLSMNLLNLAGLKNYFMAAYLIRIRKYLPSIRSRVRTVVVIKIFPLTLQIFCHSQIEIK